MKRIVIVTLILFLCAFSSLQAQRVGVVFSGGGAKGLYHIGILKALEENRIPIDYIAGTSMGAIIGGLYAVGYTPEEMARLFLSDQVKLWMSGQIESEYAFYFNRTQPRQDMLSVDLDFKAERNIAVIPTSLVPSTQIDMAFNEMFSPATAATGGDFDRLMVPFRCVASDVFNKQAVVYRNGDLGRAIRASMTIPMVFRPLQDDSVLLYDGGIYNNFPWEVLEEDFQPDVFIGGKCIKTIPNPDESSLVEQIQAITMMHTDFTLPEGRGVLIERIFADIGVLDFGKAQQIMDAGYADAMAMMDQIRAKISRRQSPQELWNRRLAFRSQLPELVFDDYRVQGLTGEQAGFVRRLLGLDERRERSFSYPEFKSAYFKILSAEEILGDYPEMAYNDTTGFFTVRLSLRNRPSLRLKIGGNISSTALNQAYFGAEYKMLARSSHAFSFDGNFSGAYTSLRGGWRTDFHLRSPVSFELKYNSDRYNLRRAPHWSRFGRYGYHGSRDNYLSAALGFPLGRSSVLLFRFNAGSDRFDYYDRDYISQQYGSSDRTAFDFYGTQLEWARYTLNHTQFATRGLSQSLSALFVNGRERFRPGENYRPPGGATAPPDQAAVRSWLGARYTREQYFSLDPRFSMGYLVDAVYVSIPELYTAHATNFVSPGFAPTPYSRFIYMNQFRSRMFLGLGAMPTVEFANNLYLKSGGYLFLSEKQLKAGFRIKEEIRYILDFTLVYQSPIGPASLTVTNFEESTRRLFIVFNFGFMLFNKRGLFY